WTQLFPAISPSPRASSSMAFDGNDGYVLLFGGEDVIAGTSFRGDTWKFGPITTVPAPADFAISINPTSATVLACAFANFTLTLTGLNGFTDSVGLSASINPSTGLSCNLSPASVSLSSTNTAGPSALSCSGSALDGGIGPSSYAVTVSGIGVASGKTHSTTFTVTVQDFTISASPTSVSPAVGVAGTSMIMLGSLPVTGTRFSGTVSLAVTTNSSSLSCNVNPTSDTFPFSPVTLSCTGSTVGNYNATVTGTSSSLSHSVSVIYDVMPSIHPTTTAVNCTPSSVTVGTVTTCTVTVTDTSLTAATNPIGTATIFASGSGIFAPPSKTCTLSASGTSAATCQVTYTPQAVGSGSQSISAGYSGDSTHSPPTFTSPFTLTITLASPGIGSTVTPASITIGGFASDLAALTGGFTPSGAVTYTAYNDSACTKLVFTSASIPLGTHSGVFTPSTAGTYHWIASYGGDANNNAVATTCGATGETLIVNKATPTVTTAVSPATITIGASATDLATVSGGFSPSGTVIYTAYSDSACTTLVFTSANVPLGIASGAFTPSAAGTYYWVASYGSDANNNAVTTTCGAVGETLTVTAVSFDYSLSVSPVGASIVAGSSTSATVTATLAMGTAQSVALVLSLSPNPAVCQVSSGVSPCGTISFLPSSIIPTSTGATSTLTISTTGIVPPGTYILTITGSPGGSSSSSATFTLTITAPSVSTVCCGHDLSCSVLSNATLTHVKFAGITIHAEADGPKGAHGYANITVPRTAIPNIDNLHVFVDNSKLARSDVTVTSNSTDYFIYFTFTFHSPVQIDIQLTVPENAPSLILGLDPTLFYEIVGALVAVFVVIVALAVMATRRRSRGSNIPRQR
ncbi:MAG TPA: hypothetical protein VGA05_05325, partial [Candidatus Bathyarchaeia archaeon]